MLLIGRYVTRYCSCEWLSRRLIAWLALVHVAVDSELRACPMHACVRSTADTKLKLADRTGQCCDA